MRVRSIGSGRQLRGCYLMEAVTIRLKEAWHKQLVHSLDVVRMVSVMIETLCEMKKSWW